MAKYVIKRVIESILTVFVIATIVFLLMRCLPTDNYFSQDQLLKLNADQKEVVLKEAGLLDPMPVQLVRFYKSVFTLDFGISHRVQDGLPVLSIISDRMAISLQIGIISMVVSLVAGTFLGGLQTMFKDRFIDGLGTGYSILVNAVPGIVLYSLVWMLGTRVFHLPAIYTSSNAYMSSILPVICLCIVNISGFAIWTRRYMVDELNRDYIKLARVKGLSPRQIYVKHIFRNAFVPMVQYIPIMFVSTIGGSLLVERFFSIPGMGSLLTDAISKYDLNTVQALVIIYAALGVFGVFLGDILMMIIDPRISLTEKEGGR